MSGNRRSLRRLLLFIALGCGIAIAVIPPAGYAYIARWTELQQVEHQAHEAAEEVSRFAYAQGRLWHFHQHRLDEHISRTELQRKSYLRRVLLPDGRIVAEQGATNALFRIVHRAPITVRGNVEGYVEFVRSLEEYRSSAIFIAAASLLFGIFVFAVVYFLPVRALDRTLRALGATNTKLQKQMAETMRAYHTLEEHDRALQLTNAELDRARGQAEASSRIKSEFLANMSHELRTPLNAIIGFSEMMRSEILGPIGQPKYLEYLAHVQNSGTHLMTIINDILDLARVESGKVKLARDRIDVPALISECCQLVRGQAETAGLTVAFDASEAHDAATIGERTKIKQIVLNLLANAIKFNAKGGRVEARVGREGDKVVISVSDTGIGMRPEDVPLAFERFRQVDGSHTRKYGGTGLGLPIAKTLVELHGGTLAIETAPMRGTTVTIRLPAADRGISAAAA